MACTGYDSRTVKLPKSVKRSAATILDSHVRGAFIRSYVRLLGYNTYQSKNSNFKGKYK